jgi:hypothetical protein
VKGAELLLRRVERGGDLAGRRHVARDGEKILRLHAFGNQRLVRLVERFLAARGHADLRALGGEGPRHAEADAAARARDEDMLAGQFEIHETPPMFRLPRD